MEPAFASTIHAKILERQIALSAPSE